MELAMGAMAPVFSKLFELLENKYVEQRGLKREIESLSMEMEMVHAALMEVSRMPPDRLSEPDKIWARHIRELSYDMEDAIDMFMVRVAMRKATSSDTNVFMMIYHKVTSLINEIQERHHISDKIKDITNFSKKLSQLCTRYAFNGHAPPVNTEIDPRVINLYKNEGELVGIEEARDQLIQMLMHQPEDESLKIISIIGCGGLEDCFIEKSPLIWRWIAEGFVQLQKEGHQSLFEVGERYFNELLNPMLDLIRDLSQEQNFITILDEKQFLPLESVARKHGSERKVRRMAIKDRAIPGVTIGMPEGM
ncbi:hypothetical protein PR202_gb25253 [Eleusine coracana subsp. coracana]|uniref:Rx N-terminal domain-containing protein n=1 Tax=Eleusine coracana subsp. coracana TaxID=191504 RepID=A0AAV5FNP6_ELECO|nr:hypothetical protein PR202_gb25252 [Eleusine coracana subsp. coracana]GJN36397.1 hypothetical protein PR202_gb25253 [Eleusine coracana subsp. coracana]